MLILLLHTAVDTVGEMMLLRCIYLSEVIAYTYVATVAAEPSVEYFAILILLFYTFC